MARKLRPDAPRVVTANRLRDGVVVYRTAAGAWSPALDDAHVVASTEAEEGLLRACTADVADCLVVGLDVIEVQIDAHGAIAPISQREAIRAVGPSIALPQDRAFAPLAAPA
ncbi:DUF2849 domain-containing protein [Roseospira navarrensis]|uniref:DUF2849 domain-containing protein n=1 Tax=Roseospira navarrensis TaxID=140058 RepID=A0A7X1ZGA7_9PROT|nr:DUF2849 domain-containing protein [Roseospira navarrensis]MQX38038.1 DUF2849 domain-containing protein [Roseospira navarrensis]